MNLGDELRAVLSQEADMHHATRPDVDRLIIGGRTRKRRRNVTRVGSAALALVLVGGGAYGITQLDSGNAEGTGIVDQPTSTAGPSAAAAPTDLPGEPGFGDLEPGTYRVVVGGIDSTGAPLEAELTFKETGWDGGNFPTITEDGRSGGLGVYRPHALAAGSGCDGDIVTAYLGESPHALAQQLAQLPGSTLVQPVTPAEALGRYALHLRVRIPQECPSDSYYRVAETPRGSRGVTYGDVSPAVVMDFWVMELNGEPIVLDAWHDVDASDDLVDKIARARESITFVTAD